MSMLSPIYTDDEIKTASTLVGPNRTAASMQVAIQQIRVVKQPPMSVNSRRREELLRNIDYFEAQVGRLTKMARDIRAEVLLLTTE
jgi:hypothetical protein